MLTQILNYKSEIQQHLLVVVFFLGFIFYSLYNQLGLNLWILLLLLIFCVLSVYLLMKNQTKNRQMVSVQLIEKANKYKVVKRKIAWIVFPFLLYTILTLLHFYIVYLGTGDYMPMVYDYGFGGLLALVFNIYIFNNWKIGISDDGIIIGSRFDAKLIQWKNIVSVDYQGSEINIVLKNTSIQRITLVNLEQQLEIQKLLKYKVL